MSEREITAAPPFWVEIFVVLLLVVGLVWAWPDLRAWLHSRTTPAAVALNECPPPTEHEHLYIIVKHRDGRLVSECMYFGSRGTYRGAR